MHHSLPAARRKLRVALAACVGGISIANVWAGPTPYPRQQLKLTGNLSIGMASSDRRLSDKDDVAVARASLKLTHALAPGVYWRYDAGIASRSAHGGGNAFAVREAYLNYRDGPFDMKVGLQNIAWGRADLINPTDNLTPYRYTWLTLTDADQRVGTMALQFGYHFGFGKLTAISLPILRPSKVPLGDTGGLAVREAKPDDTQEDFAIRLERQGAGPEWSLSWFHGHSLRPNLVPVLDTSSAPQIELGHPRVDVLGGDFAMPWRSRVIRGEMAYTRAKDCCDFGGIQFRKRDNLFAVIGLETAIGDGWRLVTQAFHKQNFEERANSDVSSPLLSAIAHGSDILNDEHRPEYTGASLGIYSTELSARWRVSADLAWIAQTGDFALRPRMSYTIGKDISVNVAGDLYDGNGEGPLGRLEDNSLLFTTIEWAFSGTTSLR